MRKSIIYSVCAVLALATSCETDKTADDGYSKTPVIDEVKITPLGSGAAGVVVAGYDARIEAEFTAGDHPLETLKFIVTSGADMITSGTSYLEEGQTTASYEFTVPFTKNLNDNTYFDILLILEDSEGNQAEAQLAEEENVKIKRPTLGDKLYLVNSSDGKVAEMSKVVGSDYKYQVDGDFGTAVSFRIAEKLTGDDEIDYNGFVWAAPEKQQLKSVANDTSLPASISEPNVDHISQITFDVFSFLYSYQIEEKGAMSVNNVEMISGTYPGYSSASVALTLNEEVEFKNFINLEKQINPTFFEYVSSTKAKFLGQSGTYELHLHDTDGYIYVDQKDAVDGVWMMTNNLAFPNWGYYTLYRGIGNGSWGWSEPRQYAFCRKDPDGVYFVKAFFQSSFSVYFLTSRSSTMPNGETGTGPSHRLSLEDNYTYSGTGAASIIITGTGDQIGRWNGAGLGTRVFDITIDTVNKTLKETHTGNLQP